MARLVSLFQNVTEIIASRARHYTDDVVEKGFVLPVDCALAKLILEIVEFKELHAPHFFAVLFHILNLSYYFQSENGLAQFFPRQTDYLQPIVLQVLRRFPVRLGTIAGE